MKKYFILILTLCSILISCKPDPTLPTVGTCEVSDITETSATCTGEVADNGNAEITAKGFCWSTEQNPTLEDDFTTSVTRNEPAIDVFTSTLHNLTANTKYYVRAYATNSVGTAYGEELDFMTLGVDDGNDDNNDEGDDDNNEEETVYEFVDLGLPSGVKWASYNVGATAAHEWGNYYSWGEITDKEEYSISNCTSYQKDLGDVSGNPEYDVATAEWGEGWRTPRLEDMYELVTQCDWIWAQVDGVQGINVVSRENGNHIFLPASGFKNSAASAASGNEASAALDRGISGYYWTTTPYSEEIEGGSNTNKRACFLVFESSGYMTDQGLRYNGFSIRPVRD